MAKKKAASKPTAKDVAAKVDKAAPGTATAQALIPDAFAPREPEIERARKSLARAAAESKKVGEKKRAAYQDLKSAMFEAGLTVYKSHDAPVVITLEPEGAPVKMRDVKEDEATPYKPGRSDDDK